MTNITLKQSLQKKGLRISFLILCSLFISENTFSRNKWDKSFVTIAYYKSLSSSYISLTICFFHYEFGAFGEHGFLKNCEFFYSIDGRNHRKIMGCEVEDQVYSETSIITMKDKLPGFQIAFSENIEPSEGFRLPENEKVRIKCRTVNYKSFIVLKWIIPSYQNIVDIVINGEWIVNGLYCSDFIVNQRYLVPDPVLSRSELNIESKHKYEYEPGSDQPKNKVLKVNKDADVIIIKGAELGDDIQVYATSGTLVKSIAADQDVVNIKLPPNQVYIVKVGLVRYKVAL